MFKTLRAKVTGFFVAAFAIVIALLKREKRENKRLERRNDNLHAQNQHLDKRVEVTERISSDLAEDQEAIEREYSHKANLLKEVEHENEKNDNAADFTDDIIKLLNDRGDKIPDNKNS